MKRLVKALVLILLAAAIVGSTAWYLLEYDKDFTHDLLLDSARYFEKNGQYGISTWLYNQAFRYSESVDQISLELAEHYRSVGNYAKVEEILLNAIRQGGGIEVYIALSNAFVEQDKLLDAQLLLDGVTDEALRNQLSLLRPAAPVPSQNAGHYNEYISVSFQSTDNTVYVSSAGTTPSAVKDLHTEPVILGPGKTVLVAVAVGPNGLVSTLSRHEYAVLGVIEPVVFADAEMEKALRAAAGIPTGVTVYTNDLWNIRAFTVPAGVKNYSDLKHLSSLETLEIIGGKVSLTLISNLTNLTSLTLRNCSISSLAGLEKLTKLTYLDLGENMIRDLSALSGLTLLQSLYLENNAVVELKVLSGLSALQVLDLSHNAITNLSPLSSLTGLQQLDLSSNAFTDISALSSLKELLQLNLSANQLSSINALGQMTKLTELDVSRCDLTDISVLTRLMALEKLDFSNNQVKNLPAFSKGCALITIDGSYNQISNVDALSGLANLSTIELDYNASISKVDSLAKCPALISVSVYGTKVKTNSAVKDLTKLNIIVYYKK